MKLYHSVHHVNPPSCAISVQAKSAYNVLDSFHHGGSLSLTALLDEAEQLRKQQDLFELYVVDYVLLQRCVVSVLYMCAFHECVWSCTCVFTRMCMWWGWAQSFKLG